MTNQKLFDGAITINIPAHYINASILRQIPDHQEVFLTEGIESLIIEILEHVPIIEHWNDLCTVNEAESEIIYQDDELIHGRQSVMKDKALESVELYVGVVHLDSVDADILITWHHPGELNNFREMIKSLNVLEYGLFA